MSNLSDIGFSINTQEDFINLIEKSHEKSTAIPAKKGTYLCYSDPSGAELWIQMNKKNELIGANPHFKGKSKRTIGLTTDVARKAGTLDGAFHAWANPQSSDPESGEYPFVFDVPNHKTLGTLEFPQNIDIQLSAFAQEFEYFETEEEFTNSQEGEMKFATKFFIPSGLFDSDGVKRSKSPDALGVFAGIIKDFDKKENELTGEKFYWIFVDTLGGEIDVLADLAFLDREPKVGGVVHGQFWLSGTLLSQPEIKKTEDKKGIFSKFFGR